MAKQTETKAEETTKAKEPVLSKRQLKKMFNSDIVGAIFADDEKVTKKQAESRIKNFLNKEVH